MDTRRRRVRQVWTRFLLYSFGVFFVYSAYGTLLSLQSSINVVDGLGTTGLAVIYGSAVVFSVLCAPAILRKYEAKKCVYFCEITYIIYILSNFYPSFYTIIPSSVVVGMGDCLLWSCFPIMNTFFANLHSTATGKEISQSLEARFSGYFFAVFQMAKIAGNMISYAVLYGFNESGQHLNATSARNNSSSNSSMPTDYAHCGAHDCLDDTKLLISQYVPKNDWTLYLLLSVMAFMCLGAVIMHCVCIPDTAEFLATRRKRSSANQAGTSEKESKSTLLSSVDEKDKDHPTAKIELSEREDGKKDVQNVVTNKDDTYLLFAMTTLRDVVQHFLEPKQLLLLPMCVYAGLGFGFLTSEITRSYSSCVFGVAWVPIHASFFGVGAVIVCYTTGKLSKLLSRNVFVTFAAICDITMYLYCHFWNPETASHISLIPVYLILGGMIGGVWVPVSQVSQVITFPDRLDVVTPVWNFWFMGGIGAQFAWSSSICVDTKIYIQLGVLVITLFGYGISEWLRKRNTPEDNIKVSTQDKL